MNQPRHDIYTGVHKGLRRRLAATSSILESCNFASSEERGAAIAHVVETIAFLEEHASHEDTHIQPRVADANRALAERLAQAHLRVEHSAKVVADLAEAIGSATAEVAVARGPELCHAFNVLASQHLEHMNEEETLANAALWEAHTDDELREFQGVLLASIPPQRYVEWLHLMLPALNVHEHIGMLSGMKIAAPPEVFEMVMGLGGQLLGERWEPVTTAVSA